MDTLRALLPVRLVLAAALVFAWAAPMTPAEGAPHRVAMSAEQLDGVSVRVALRPPGAVPDTWHRAFRLPYGSARTKVATSPGGDGGTTRWGPDFGVQMPGGTWWVVDTAKTRLAHFSSKGRFLGAVKVPKRFLINGIYFPYSHPRALRDGSVVLCAPGEGSTDFLVLKHGQLSRFTVPIVFTPVASNGKFLFGLRKGGGFIRVNPSTGGVMHLGFFRGQDNADYNISMVQNRIFVERWTPGFATYWIRELRVRSAVHPSDKVHPSIEVAVGVNGTLSLLITGLIESTPGEVSEVDGYLTIDKDGVVSPVERMRRPWSPSDPGTGGHLGIRQGTSTPWLMFVDTDGVRVFTRAAS